MRWLRGQTYLPLKSNSQSRNPRNSCKMVAMVTHICNTSIPSEKMKSDTEQLDRSSQASQVGGYSGINKRHSSSKSKVRTDSREVILDFHLCTVEHVYTQAHTQKTHTTHMKYIRKFKF